MKVKDLIARLNTLNPEADVVGFCTSSKNDFNIHAVETDVVADYGSDSGFHTEHGLSKFPTRKVSVCDTKPVGETVVVIH